MYNKPAPSEIHHSLLTLIILLTLLTACAPTGTTTPEPAAVDTATAEFTETVTFTVTATSTFTATPSTTPTATLSPEEAAAADQEAIRAEILSYGINLDDLANSDNEYIRNHPSVESFQEELDNNFKEGEAGTELMVMLELEQLHSEAEYKRSVTTDGGWKFIVWAKVAYKDASGNWQIANMPLMAYHEETETLWFKYAQPTEPWFWEDWKLQDVIGPLKTEDDGSWGTTFVKEQIYENDNYRLETGDLFRLNTSYPDPNSNLNAGEVGETPRYSQEELEYFQQTGDASIFEYQTLDGTYIIWPFVTSSTITTIDYQPIH